ncbi:hypothetical protein OTUT144_2095 [Orientia tsutsugamushi str. UT144]|uniref:Uncharacterized protein n=1 Tax=Orientia tsutsugamushi str. UT144 TaxID=1441384 RepID=A0A0F3RL41_ORITS|nr:hypothetical protein OTUT144_2095 [Orientia tsutsugamushi str. UT144]
MPSAISNILDILFKLQTDGTYTLSPQLMKVLEHCKCSLCNISNILRGSKLNVATDLTELLRLLESFEISKLDKLKINFLVLVISWVALALGLQKL